MRYRSRGFSLVEMSVALLALGLVLLAATAFWQQSERARASVVQQTVQTQARQALVGFLYAHHRLPCPAVDAAGTESCLLPGGGLHKVGYVPWRTLGFPRPEAGQLRYGVYREASATAAVDRDLANATDRMNPLRVPTPNPRPANGSAPNSHAPPFPVASEGLIGQSQSGDPSLPLNVACNASNTPPCPLGGLASVNQIDVCLALNTASKLSTAPADQLAVQFDTERRPVAFVVVAPGLLDADGDGKSLDGDNASASDANPTFEAASKAISDQYDDQVLAASHAELFSELNCAAGLSATIHSHFDAAIGAFVMERAMYDYRDQLYINIKLAEADVASAAAGVLSAAAATVDAGQAVVSATGDAFASVGARSFQIALAAAGVVLAVIGDAAAVASVILAAASLASAQQTHADFAARTTAITDLSISINQNALTADAIGF